MAVPKYTTDLVDIDLCESGGKTWAEPTAVGWTYGAGPTSNDDDAIQGSLSMAKAFNATGVGGMLVNNTAGITLPTNGAFLGWFIWACPASLETDANGGIRMMVGTDLANFLSWDVGGSTTYIYGGWTNFAVNTTLTPDDTVGTGLGNSQYVGAAVNNLNSIFKGSPFVSDAYRYGRCQARFTGGETANYATFAGYAAVNDAQAARWGLIQAVAGGYLWKGIMLIGLSTVVTTYRARTASVATLTTGAAHGFVVGDILTMTGIGGSGYNVTATVGSVPTTTTFTYASPGSDEGSTADAGGSINGVVDFRDSNRTVFIQYTPKVTSVFNRIEIRNASTNVDWSNVNFVNLSPSTTASKGDLEVIDNATVVMDACNFTDMNTFIFLGNSDVTNSQFLRCGQITGGGGLFNGTSVLTSTVAADTGAFVYNESGVDPDGELDNMTFSKGTNAHHAIDFGTNVTGNITLRGIEFTGFGSTGDSNDSTVRFLATGGSLTLSLVGCTVNGSAASSSNFSIDDAAGISVTLSIDPVTTLVNIKDFDGNNEAGVAVYLEAADASGDLPYQQSITSITRSGSGPGSTATVIFAAAHGLENNEYLKLYGITDTNNQLDLSGAFQVTVTGTTTLTYPTETTGPSPYNGTITGTGATIYGTTDASGNISSSRTYSANQPLTGYARKSDDGTTYFKPIDLDDTVNSSTGLTINRRLVSDGLV